MSLEKDLEETNVTQRTELEGVAKELFDDKLDKDGLSSNDQKTNLTGEEIGLCMVNDIIFNVIEMPELSPTRSFKRLSSSKEGWKVESFVKTAQGQQDVRGGMGFGSRLGRLFGGNRE